MHSIKVKQSNRDRDNRMLRVGFGKKDGAGFFRVDLWAIGFRLTVSPAVKQDAEEDFYEPIRLLRRNSVNWDWQWISWFKGTVLQWGEFRFNNGHPYKSYRFGPLLIRVFLTK